MAYRGSNGSTPPRAACFVLAGGEGRRLSPLTLRTPKPLLPFGGTHRLLDFTLSNVANSGLERAYVLTQHLGEAIGEYLRIHWKPTERRPTHFIHLPAASGKRYRGTGSSVAWNLDCLPPDSGPILVLSADHIYRMDYRELLECHIRSGAGVTLSVTPVSVDSASEFGIASTGPDGRITKFIEKPEAEPEADGNGEVLASMGVYVFSRPVLARVLGELDGRHRELDFGRDVLPWLVRTGEAFAWTAADPVSQAFYWRDVGTFAAYYDAHMDLVGGAIPFDPADPDWPVCPSAATCDCDAGALSAGESPWTGSIVASPLMFGESMIERSILSPEVTVGDGADVLGSIVLPGAHIGRDAAVRNAIVDAYAEIADGEEIGYDTYADHERFDVTEGGIVVVSPIHTDRTIPDHPAVVRSGNALEPSAASV